MPAQVDIQLGSGANPGTWTPSITSVRFRNSDSNALDATNPLVKPSSAGVTNYSFEKIFRLWVTTGPSNSLSNLRFHRVGTMPTGISDRYGTATSYTAPAGGAQTISSIAQTSVPETATSITTGTQTISSGQSGLMFGPYFYIQWGVSNTATAGTTTSVTYRWTFDES